MLDAFVMRLLRRHVGVCHVGAHQPKSDSLYKSAHVHQYADVAADVRGRSQLRPGSLARADAPQVDWNAVPVFSALVDGRHDGAITQHGRLQRHGNVALGRETRWGSGLEVAADAP